MGGTYSLEFTRIRAENICSNREAVLNQDEEEVNWYPKPTVNATILTEDGRTQGMSVSFDHQGNVTVNGITIDGASGLTQAQLQQWKDDNIFLWNKARAVLNSLADEQDMT